MEVRKTGLKVAGARTEGVGRRLTQEMEDRCRQGRGPVPMSHRLISYRYDELSLGSLQRQRKEVGGRVLQSARDRKPAEITSIGRTSIHVRLLSSAGPPTLSFVSVMGSKDEAI